MFNPDPTRLRLTILRAEQTRVDDQWAHARIQWWFWRLIRFEDAPAELILDEDDAVDCEAGCFLIVPPVRRFRRRALAATRHLFVHFSVDGLPDAFWRDIIPPSNPVRPDGQLQGLARDLGARLETPDDENRVGRNLHALGLVAQVFGRVIDTLGPDQRQAIARAVGADDVFGRATEHAEARRGALRVGDLAEICGYSTDHFSRLFRGLYGVTPSRYLQEVRVRHAAQLLLETALSIEQIAEQTGFSDRFHFSRVFGVSTGLGPAGFRRQCQGFG
jgi:AraC-like DNA-binding protein